MGIIRRSGRAGHTGGLLDTSLGRTEVNEDAGFGRWEAASTATAVPVDPYAAWLERRAEEEERGRPEIRWVYRYADGETATDAARPADDGPLVGSIA